MNLPYRPSLICSLPGSRPSCGQSGQSSSSSSGPLEGVLGLLERALERTVELVEHLDLPQLAFGDVVELLLHVAVKPTSTMSGKCSTSMSVTT